MLDLSYKQKITWRKPWDEVVPSRLAVDCLSRIIAKYGDQNPAADLRETINDTVDDIGNTAFIVILVHLTNQRRIEKLQKLLDNGANINAQNWRGQTALTISIELADFELVDFLLSNGAVVQDIDVFYIFFDPKKNGLHHALALMPTIPALLASKDARKAFLAENITHNMWKLAMGSGGLVPKMVEPHPIMTKIVSSSEDMKIFANNMFAKLILDLKIYCLSSAFFSHKSLDQFVDQFDLNFYHPIFESIKQKSVEGVDILLKSALASAQPPHARLNLRFTFSIFSVNCNLEWRNVQTITPLSYLLAKFEVDDSRHSEILTLLLENDYPFGDQDEAFLSPLTLFILRAADTHSRGKSFKAVGKLFDSKLPIILAKTQYFDQNVLRIFCERTILRIMRNYFYLPDALMVALLSFNFAAVVKLLQYWPHSPAYLGLVLLEVKEPWAATARLKQLLDSMAREFLDFGLLHGLINKYVSRQKLKQLNTFVNGRVSTLQQLAAHTIRENCESVCGSKLPEALEPLVAGKGDDLRSLLLMQPRDHVLRNLEELAQQYLGEIGRPLCSFTNQ